MEKVYRYTDIQLAALEAAIADKMEYYATDEEKAHLAIKAMMINDLCLKRHIDSEFIYPNRRKTPPFRAGDIRRVLRIYASN